MPERGISKTSQITNRPATPADFAAEHRVFCRAEGGLLTGHGFEWSNPPFEAFAAIQQHLLDTDPGRCHLAEMEGEVVGFTAAFTRDDRWFLSALFIDPAVQGRGLGRALLGRALAGAPSRRMTITDSIQPISNALYGRHGLLPATPVLGFSGTGRPVAPPAWLEEATASPEALTELDAATYGFDRQVDHAFWARLARQHLWARNGRLVGCSYAWPSGRIGPLLAADAASAADILTAELAANPSGWIEMPGSSRSLVATALTNGMRLEAPVGLLLLANGATVPSNTAISGYFLA